jgi:chromosome segregation ATPase
MKKMIFTLIVYSNFCIANEPPVLQTFLPPRLPSISSHMLAVTAQLKPQTKSHHETPEEEITRLKTQYKEKEQETQQLLIRIKSLEGDLLNQEKENEKLKESLHHVTFVSRSQKTKIEEQEHLLEIATREIVEHQSAQEDHQRRIAEVISNGYKKLEQMKASQKERGVIS